MVDRNALARSSVSAARIGWLVPRLAAAGLDTRKIEERVHQLEQAKLVAVNHLEIVACQRPLRRCERFLRRPKQQGKGRAEFVADVGEKPRLHLVEFGERFGTLDLLLVKASVGERRGNLVGCEDEKVPVFLVEGETGTDPGDENSVQDRCTWSTDRYHPGGLNRLRPAGAGDITKSLANVGHENWLPAVGDALKVRCPMMEGSLAGECGGVGARGDQRVAPQSGHAAIVADGVAQRPRNIVGVVGQGGEDAGPHA